MMYSFNQITHQSLCSSLPCCSAKLCIRCMAAFKQHIELRLFIVYSATTTIVLFKS